MIPSRYLPSDYYYWKGGLAVGILFAVVCFIKFEAVSNILINASTSWSLIEENVTQEECINLPTFRDLVKKPFSIAQDDPRLIDMIRNEYLRPSSDLPYNLANPEIDDPSDWQAKEVRRVLNDKKNGFFIECGAFNGEHMSNTLYLERFLGWKGILIEPVPKLYEEMMSKNRKSWTAQVCLSTDNFPSEVVFQQYDLGSAIEKFSVQESNKQLFNVPSFPLFSILMALDQTKIDYFSLDVESVEFQVLKTIPWDKVNITVISVEIQFLWENQKKDLKKYMKKLGYNFAEEKLIDYLFYHPLLLGT